MAENPLEREHVAAGHKVVDGESMTEQVDVEPGDIRALLGAANHERHGLAPMLDTYYYLSFGL